MRSWQADEWPSVRARGKRDFLFRYGFLGRGLPLGVVAAGVIEALFGSPFPAAFSSPAFILRFVAFIGVFTLSGCMAANFNWNLHERRFAGDA